MPRPIVSIIVETGTQKMSGRLSLKKTIGSYLAEARRTLPDREFEFILVGKGKPGIKLDKNCRFLDRPRVGYYGWKNSGAMAARGHYLVYWDSDCRVVQGYLKKALEDFRKNPDVIGLGGLTVYDDRRFFGRVNTVLNFGPHFKNPPRYTGLSVTVNNICLVRKAFPQEPFGPFTGRTGGDSFITQYAVKAGKPFLQDKGLRSYHEDQTAHPRTFAERTFRDLFQPILKTGRCSLLKAWSLAFLNSPVLFLKRIRRILLFGRAAGLSWTEMILSPSLPLCLTLTELTGLLCMALWPPLLKHWLDFQFGASRSEKR